MRGDYGSDRAQVDEDGINLLRVILVLALGGALVVGQILGLPAWAVEYGLVIISAVADDDD